MSWTLVVVLLMGTHSAATITSVAVPKIPDAAACAAAGRNIIASSWANKERSSYTCVPTYNR